MITPGVTTAMLRAPMPGVETVGQNLILVDPKGCTPHPVIKITRTL